MPPRKAKKGGKGAKKPVQFSALDTTPTSRQFQSPQPAPSADEPPPAPAASTTQPTEGPDESDASLEEILNQLNDDGIVCFDGVGSAQKTNHNNEASLWAEVGSQTRRSSPVVPGDTPKDFEWPFENEGYGEENDGKDLDGDGDNEPDSLSFPMSTPNSSGGNLPDTMPLPPDYMADLLVEQVVSTQKRVDFSETASTARRSSPLYSESTVYQNGEETSIHTPQIQATTIRSNPEPLQVADAEHFPSDNIYDATPFGTPLPTPRASVHKRPGHNSTSGPAAKSVAENQRSEKGPGQRSMVTILETELAFEDEEVVSDPIDQNAPLQAGALLNLQRNGTAGALEQSEDHLQTVARGGQKSKKRKQRAKTPIQFDPTTQEAKERPAKRPAIPSKMPILNTLRESAEIGISPAGKKKNTARAPKARKKAQSKSPTKRSGGPTTVAPTLTPVTIAEVPSVPIKRQKQVDHNPSVPDTNANTNKKKMNGKLLTPITQPIVVSSDSNDASSESASLNSSPPPLQTGNTTVDHAQHQRDISNAMCIPLSRPSPGRSFYEEDFAASAGEDEPSKQTVSHVYTETSDPVPTSNQIHRVMLNPRLEDLGDHMRTLPRQTAITRTTRKSTELSKDRDAPPVKLPWKNRRVSRNISISEAGSPVYIQNDTGSLIDRTGFEGPATIMSEGKTCRKLRYHPVKVNGIATGEAASGAGRQSMKSQLLSSVSAPTGFTRATAEAVDEGRKGDRERYIKPKPTLPPQFSLMNREMHDKILAALQGQDARFEADNEKSENKNQRQDDKKNGRSDHQKETVNQMSEQLHKIVDMMQQHLRSKEVGVYRAAEVYRERGMDSVRRIENKYHQERQELVQTSESDAEKFMNKVNDARKAVNRNIRAGEEVLKQTVERFGARRLLYRRATANLRALHARLQNSGSLVGVGML